MEITSTAFEDNGSIPSKYSCDGEGVSPPLSFGDIPASAKSLALIVDDPDVPKQLKPDGVFDHWVLFNIPPTVAGIPEGSSVGTMGNNGTGKKGYTGPCPPPQYEPKEHRYVFTLYALDAMLPLQAGASKAEVLNAALNHVVGEAQLIGRYQRAQ